MLRISNTDHPRAFGRVAARTGVVALAALTLVAVPQAATALENSDSPDNNNFELTKQSSTDGPVVAGETIDYLLVLDSNWDGFPTPVTIVDTMGPGLI